MTSKVDQVLRLIDLTLHEQDLARRLEIKGDRGEKGDQGVQGIPGEKGDDGPVGSPGVQGERGLPGERGSDGEIGPPGPPGTTGDSGRDGAEGQRGPPGLQGAAGFPGTGFKWKGTWQAQLEYSTQDVVEHLGSSWVAVGPTAGQPGNSKAWELVAAKGAAGRVVGGGWVSFGPVGSTPNVKGASIANDGGILILEPADATNPGLVTPTSQTFGGQKKFLNGIQFGDGTTQITAPATPDLSGYETAIHAAATYETQAAAASFETSSHAAATYTTPAAALAASPNVSIGTSNGLSVAAGQVLSLATATTGAAGAMSAADKTTIGNQSGTNSGDVTIGTANGLSLSGQAISMAAAGAAASGAVTTSSQTFKGAKTFSDPVSLTATSGQVVLVVGAGGGSSTAARIKFSADGNGFLDYITQGNDGAGNGGCFTPGFFSATLGFGTGGNGGNLQGMTFTNTGQVNVLAANDTKIVSLKSASGTVYMNADVSGLDLTANTSARVRMAATNSVSSPGNTTINKPSGQVAIAALASSVTVTNSLVTATSIIVPVIQTADATLTSIKSCVPTSGSFTITGNAAATAAVTIGFIVFN